MVTTRTGIDTDPAPGSADSQQAELDRTQGRKYPNLNVQVPDTSTNPVTRISILEDLRRPIMETPQNVAETAGATCHLWHR
jgi:hypothetical protein